jgi:hypothetical protein
MNPSSVSRRRGLWISKFEDVRVYRAFGGAPKRGSVPISRRNDGTYIATNASAAPATPFGWGL